MPTKYALITLFLLFSSIAYAQNEQKTEKKHYPKNIIGVGVGAAFIPLGKTPQGDNAVAVALEAYYVRKFGKKWGTIFMSERELKEYEVKIEGNPVKRKDILILGVGVYYKVLPKFKLAFGPVYEIAKNDQYFVAKLMAKYELFSNDKIDGFIGT